MAPRRKRRAAADRVSDDDDDDEQLFGAGIDSGDEDGSFLSDEYGVDSDSEPLEEDGGEDDDGEDDEEEGEGDEEDGEEEASGAKVEAAKDEELAALEEQVRELDDQNKSILKDLMRHKDEDALKGKCIKNQKVLWDKTLEFRVSVGKAFSNSNRLPKESVKSQFCNSDKAITQAYADLMSSTQQTLHGLLDLQEVLLQQNPAIVDGDKVDDAEPSRNEASSIDSKENEDDEWSLIQRMHGRIALFRNSAIDKWQRKTQVTTGAAAIKGKLHAFNQSVSDQVAAFMRDPSRMISRMLLERASIKIFGEIPAHSGNAKEIAVHDGNVQGDPELLDDAEFYQQLLKEFLESCNVPESNMYAMRSQPKKRKLVDRRASKSRKIRYHVHEKLVNFMAPVPVSLPPSAEMLLGNLFGSDG